MISSAAAHPTRRPFRAVYGALAFALLAAIVFGLVRHSTGWWQLAAFGLGPDVALLVGMSPGLARGQLHPRAVPLYNALHRFWGPAALGVLVVAADLSTGYVVGTLAWAFHIALDRTVGYSLRTRDGFQRA